MKTINLSQKLFLVTGVLLICCTSSNAQFLKKLGKRAEKAAERAVERRVDKEATEKTDQALDSILEPGSKKNGKSPVPNTTDSEEKPQNNNTSGNKSVTGSEGPKGLSVYSKFDFVPGDEQLFFDDFANDFVGDFPAKWNTNAGGEVVMLGEDSEKWFKLKSGYNLFFIPSAPNLPNDYTIEFDVIGIGVEKVSSASHLRIDLSDNSKFAEGENFVQASIPFCQYTSTGITVENRKNSKQEIYSTIKADIRNAIIQGAHISVAVNDERFRLWVDETKYIDVPKAVPLGKLTTLKFHANNFKDDTEQVFITNLKVAKGGEDLRRKLLSEGKISTNAILFNSGSDEIKPASMGVIRQIFQVLQQDSSIKLNIFGHTDSDGDEKSNLTLSKNRAEAVKNALVSVYGVDASRLSTGGKGESEPVGDNGTSEGKSQNRRVEFIKI
ncbi:OmpA family protein [Maribacter litopenaei]|uniref:OmpA family protein n=1 Tax=Maribacter litopenaei TaxID=2976127 RepID=A0ABY5Y5R0_9FLAO|nr:OmpA family protein [Maribacter litopenaei]UWX54371.1 OmpA family protein [Maribacter litopenaei]